MVLESTGISEKYAKGNSLKFLGNMHAVISNKLTLSLSIFVLVLNIHNIRNPLTTPLPHTYHILNIEASVTNTMVKKIL